MSKLKYTKKPGDLEIRVLADGRLVLVGPDEDMLNIADIFNTPKGAEDALAEKKIDGRTKADKSSSADRHK